MSSHETTQKERGVHYDLINKLATLIEPKPKEQKKKKRGRRTIKVIEEQKRIEIENYAITEQLTKGRRKQKATESPESEGNMSKSTKIHKRS